MSEATPATASDAQIIKRRERQAQVLEGIADTGLVIASCKAAGVHPTTHYRWYQDDEEYREMAEMAQRSYVERLEAEADRRAVEGVKKPTGWYKGVAGGEVIEYSDTLLQFRLKALDPDKYRERSSVELKGALATLDLSQLPDDMVSRIAAGEHPLSVLASSPAHSHLLGGGSAPPRDSADGQ